MEAKKLLLVGLGNYSHPQTRHSIGMLVLDYIASQLDVTWKKNKNWPANVTTTTIYVNPPKPPKIKNEIGTKMKKQAKKSITDPNDESGSIDNVSTLPNGVQKIVNNKLRLEDDNVSVGLKSDISKLTIDDDSDSDDDISSEVSSSISSQLQSIPSTSPSSVSSLRDVSPKPPNISELFRPRRRPDPIPLEVTLMKPLLLMNVSGKSVSKAIKELGLLPANIIVVHDDMQRELGKISIKSGGSANGHNGIKSVIDALKTNQFRRMRVGIGRPPKALDDRSHDVISSYVLARITHREMEYYTNEVFPKCKEQLLKI